MKRMTNGSFDLDGTPALGELSSAYCCRWLDDTPLEAFDSVAFIFRSWICNGVRARPLFNGGTMKSSCVFVFLGLAESRNST
jgi:hypothetical protein